MGVISLIIVLIYPLLKIYELETFEWEKNWQLLVFHNSYKSVFAD